MAQLSGMLAPLLLRPDNFTPPARTPWGGRLIVGQFKAGLGLAQALAAQPVGESWELSTGPELPSVIEDGRLLRDVIAQAPVEYLGGEAPVGGSALLLKWLDAAANLSVQIHPRSDDPRLAADETGKPECWYIVAREPGAAIYLGLRDGVSEADMRLSLERGDDVSQLLQRILVEPGDFFTLSPGTPHALGGGVVLLEPQFVAPGKKGVTLRYWDWNRRYDAQGRVDDHGQPRELHVEHALAVTHWGSGRASAPGTARASFGPARLGDAARLETMCGPDGEAPVRCPELRVARVIGNGPVDLPKWDSLTAVTVISGALVLEGRFGQLRVEAGRTAALPAALAGLSAQAQDAHALVCGAVAPQQPLPRA